MSRHARARGRGTRYPGKPYPGTRTGFLDFMGNTLYRCPNRGKYTVYRLLQDPWHLTTIGLSFKQRLSFKKSHKSYAGGIRRILRKSTERQFPRARCTQEFKFLCIVGICAVRAAGYFAEVAMD
eukprot:66732-Rhodomonas_salina.1